MLNKKYPIYNLYVAKKEGRVLDLYVPLLTPLHYES